MNLETSNKVASAKHVTNVPTLYPDERLIAFAKRSYSKYDCSKLKALDIGYGGGRNLKLLLDMGFDCYGIEYINKAEEQAKINLQPRSNLVKFHKGDYKLYKFNTQFDLIVAWGVFPHARISEIKTDLNHIYRMLNSSGKLIINFRTEDNWFIGKGKKIEENSYLLDKTAKEYSGYAYSFINDNELSALVSQTKFKITQKERLDLWKNNAQEQHSWIILELQK